MEDQLVKSETAELAISKGFNAKGIVIEDGGISLCTQSSLQKWLREKHEIFVETQVYMDGNLFKHMFVIKTLLNYKIKVKSDTKFSSNEKALEKGLFEALKLIKQK